MQVKRAKYINNKCESTGEKGPAKTEPKHGKKNRLPYDATHPLRRKGRK